MLGVGDPVHVEVDALAALRLVPLEREVIGIVGDHLLGERAGERVDLGEVGTASQRADHVHAARARRHRERDEPEVAQPVAGGRAAARTSAKPPPDGSKSIVTRSGS